MQVKYIVHSATREAVSVKALLGEREVEATVPGLVVELVDGETHGHTWRFVPHDDAEMVEAEALFVPGQSVAVTFSAA